MDTQDLHGCFKPWPEFSACHRRLVDMLTHILLVEYGDDFQAFKLGRNSDLGNQCGAGLWWNGVSFLAQTELFMDAHPDRRCFIHRCRVCRCIRILISSTRSSVLALTSL